MKRITLLILIITALTTILYSAKIEKNISFYWYVLSDNYKYKNIKREFQWTKISAKINDINRFQNSNYSFGILRNYKNRVGYPPLTSKFVVNAYNSYEDNYNVYRHQGIPLYSKLGGNVPKRYSLDGSLVALVSKGSRYYTIKHAFIKGIWRVPKEYFYPIKANKFEKMIFIDRTNQNITALEYVNNVWYVKSMNPATTGQFNPPYKKETPKGVFVLQDIKKKMYYLKDGTREIAGFAPYASRFCGGAYIHGVPTNYPSQKIREYSKTLGTVPLSHMCVRNASSHAKFIYQWGDKNETLIIIIE